MNCRLALERSKAPIAILRNNASSALERGGASNTPNICWPCGSIAETAPGMPIGPRSVTACSQQMKTAQLYHENPQRDCITLDRTPGQRSVSSQAGAQMGAGSRPENATSRVDGTGPAPVTNPMFTRFE